MNKMELLQIFDDNKNEGSTLMTATEFLKLVEKRKERRI